MKINDPQVTILLKNMKSPAHKTKNTNNRNNIDNINNIFKLKSLSHEICEHKIEYAKCIVCQAKNEDTSTDHKIAKLFYARFSIPIRLIYDLKDDQITLKKSKLEILKNYPGMVHRKRATFYDTLLYESDNLQNCLPRENKFRIFLFLVAKFYDVKKLTGFNIPRLTKEENNDLDEIRKFIFERQISRLHEKIRYGRTYD